VNARIDHLVVVADTLELGGDVCAVVTGTVVL